MLQNDDEIEYEVNRAMRTFDTMRWVWIALQVAFVIVPMLHVLMDPSATSQNIRRVDLRNMLLLYAGLQVVTLPVSWLAWTRPRELPKYLDSAALDRLLLRAARTRRAIYVLTPALVMAPIGLCVMVYMRVGSVTHRYVAFAAILPTMLVLTMPTVISSMPGIILIYVGLCAFSGVLTLMDYWWNRHDQSIWHE